MLAQVYLQVIFCRRVVEILMNIQFMVTLEHTRIYSVSEMLREGNSCNFDRKRCNGGIGKAWEDSVFFWEERAGLVPDGVADTPAL